MTYYKNGKLMKLIEKNNSGLIDGRIIEFYENGDTLGISNWRNGKREGLEKSFYTNNKLLSQIYIRNGSPNGRMIGFYRSGNVEIIGEYKDSLLNNELISYFDTIGFKVSSINNYINYKGIQKPMGYIIFNKDGSIKSEESRIKVKSEKDTISLGDSLKLSILLTAPKYDSTYFFIGDFEDKFYLKKYSKIDTFYSTNHSLHYALKATKKGINYARGGAKNYQILISKGQIQRRILRPELYFEYKYFVK